MFVSSRDGSESSSPLSRRATLAIVFAIGWLASLVGDACHVASGTTSYLWSSVPNIWYSGVWFPFLVASSVTGCARAGLRAQLPLRRRRRLDVLTGIAAVLALYALTATLRGQPTVVSVTLCGAIAAAIWCWWDPSRAAFSIALAAAVIGPLAEIAIMASGAARYASDSQSLWGVAPWLPCLYFAAGSVASGLWRTIERDGAD